jgi:redox-sensitive bicupin YhaK (pirin superfamily)
MLNLKTLKRVKRELEKKMSDAKTTDVILRPRLAKAGDMDVKRILPTRTRKMVGPFAFLDEMGPLQTIPGTKAGDVPAHPHIGLSTVTYLFEGALDHRDSLGSVQTINPGDLNWMTAGRGIVHSERIPTSLREKQGQLHGLQAWVALPKEVEDCDPSFEHFAAESLSAFTQDGCRIRLIAGKAFNQRAPVKTASQLFYFEANLPKEKKLEFNPEGQEAALYLITGSVKIEEEILPAPLLVIFKTGVLIEVQSIEDSHGVFFGGEVLSESRYIFWNFVSSSKEKIEEAKNLWQEQKFPAIPGESEFVPLPKTIGILK